VRPFSASRSTIIRCSRILKADLEQVREVVIFSDEFTAYQAILLPSQSHEPCGVICRSRSWTARDFQTAMTFPLFSAPLPMLIFIIVSTSRSEVKVRDLAYIILIHIPVWPLCDFELIHTDLDSFTSGVVTRSQRQIGREFVLFGGG